MIGNLTTMINQDNPRLFKTKQDQMRAILIKTRLRHWKLVLVWTWPVLIPLFPWLEQKSGEYLKLPPSLTVVCSRLVLIPLSPPCKSYLKVVQNRMGGGSLGPLMDNVQNERAFFLQMTSLSGAASFSSCWLKLTATWFFLLEWICPSKDKFSLKYDWIFHNTTKCFLNMVWFDFCMTLIVINNVICYLLIVSH